MPAAGAHNAELGGLAGFAVGKPGAPARRDLPWQKQTEKDETHG